MMHGREKSDSAIVAGKPTNKAVPTAAESVEDRYSFIVVDLHRLHGGLSTGPTTPEGMARTVAALKAGRAEERAGQARCP